MQANVYLHMFVHVHFLNVCKYTYIYVCVCAHVRKWELCKCMGKSNQVCKYAYTCKSQHSGGSVNINETTAKVLYIHICMR